MQFRNSPALRFGLRAATGLFCAAGLCAGLSAPPAQAQTKKVASETLYKLKTTCSINRGPAQDCVIEAINEGDVTLYRHTIGKTVELIRITDAPVSMSRWNAATNSWVVLTSAGARFSTNTICFNGRDLCVVNPNYLNSVREEKVDALAGRDLVGVKFSKDGRVSLTCYDEACEGVN
jgi:hypothetical protein